MGVRAPIMVIVAWIFSFRISHPSLWCFSPAFRCLPSACAAWQYWCIRCSSVCSTRTTSSTTWSTRTCRASACQVLQSRKPRNRKVQPHFAAHFQGLYKSRTHYELQQSTHDAVRVRVHAAYRMDGRPADRGVRQQCGLGFDHRRSDRTGHLRHADPHGHDDAVHDFRDVHYFAGLRRTHLPGAERGKHGYESGKSGYGSEEW